MKIQMYRAKLLSRDLEVIGFYYQQPSFTAYPFEGSAEPEIEHYIISYSPGDWGLRGEPTIHRINSETLREYSLIEV